MPATTYPQSATFGAPMVGGGLVSIPNYNGNVFYVDPANGNDTNNGLTPGVGPGTGVNGALKTITKALSLCTTNQGDTIFVMGSPSGSNENVVVTKNFVAIIGCQIGGYARPDVVPTTGTALTVNAQGFVAKHMRFAAADNSDSVIQTGNGYLYDDCVFDGNALQTTKGCVRLLPSNVVTSQTASEGVIQNCYFRGTASTAAALIMDTSALNGGSTDNQILNNRFSQNTTADIATAKTGAAATYSVKFVLVQGNFFTDKNKATYVDITTNEDGIAGNQSGSFAQNGFASDTMTTTKIKAVGTAFTFMGNYDTVGIFDGSGLD